jgi:hypothetical protein
MNKLYAAIKMYNHYSDQAKRIYLFYPDIVDWYFMFDYNMERVSYYEYIILKELF